MPNSRNTRPNHAKISPLNKPARLNSLEPPYLTSQLQFQWFNAICMTLDIRVLHTSRDLPSIAQNSHSLVINNKELKSTSLIWKKTALQTALRLKACPEKYPQKPVHPGKTTPPSAVHQKSTSISKTVLTVPNSSYNIKSTMKLPPSSPMSHKVVVGTLATVVGAYAFWQVGRDFQFVKFEPRSPEEIEKRRKEGVGLEIRSLETRLLEYTPEAKARMRAKFEEAKRQQKDEKEGGKWKRDQFFPFFFIFFYLLLFIFLEFKWIEQVLRERLARIGDLMMLQKVQSWVLNQLRVKDRICW